jgi:hypothetical protein
MHLNDSEVRVRIIKLLEALNNFVETYSHAYLITFIIFRASVSSSVSYRNHILKTDGEKGG